MSFFKNILHDVFNDDKPILDDIFRNSGSDDEEEEEATYLLNAPFTADDQGYSDAQVIDTEAEGITDGQLTVVETDGTFAVSSNAIHDHKTLLGSIAS